MDYTLAQYKSPSYESAAFRLMLNRLVDIGYPSEILKFQYDHTFPIRGLWFDKDRGCLLKVDSFGNLLSCLFGLTVVPSAELHSWYENKFVQLSDRFYVYDTLFNLPEIYCMASIIEFFKALPQASVERNGIVYKELNISYRSLFNDVRGAADAIHNDDSLKRLTVEQIDEFVHTDSDLLDLLEQLKATGAKVFLLTNSEYWYTDALMSYLLGPNWVGMFNYVLVSACKPKFFAEGSLLRVVDRSSGKLKLGTHMGPLQSGVVYSGGSCAEFSRLIGCRGKDVLYAGDHIFGDIIKSKKVGWRTLLIVPELANELFVWKQDQQLFERLQRLEAEMGRMYLHCTLAGSDSNPGPPASEVQRIRADIRDVVRQMDTAYGFLGSLFRSGGRLTSFAYQLERYADIYAQRVTNLRHYPSNYLFRSPQRLMPHESTVTRSATTAFANPSGGAEGDVAGDAAARQDGSPVEAIAATARLAMRANSIVERGR
uniref:5'-nucleotidase domain-containing protein 3 n=1 Tax=Macrostomum lignano TaxID=282301 RepID=A0A1I8IA45_9PLAT